MPDSNFVKHDEVIEHFEKSIDNFIKKRNFKNFAEPYNSRNMTECDRRILYRSYGEKPNKELFGKVEEEYRRKKWGEIIGKIPSVTIMDRNVLAANNDINLCAEVDFVCQIGDKKSIINIYDGEGKEDITRKDLVDTMTKMWIIGVKHGILIYDRRNDRYYIRHIIPFDNIIKAVCNKCKKLEQNRINGIVVDRPYDNGEKEECLLCEYHEKCWKGTKWEKDFIQNTQRK